MLNVAKNPIMLSAFMLSIVLLSVLALYVDHYAEFIIFIVLAECRYA